MSLHGPYDPLHGLGVTYEEFTARLIEVLADRPEQPLTTIPADAGEGVYMLHYHGDHPIYAILADTGANGHPWPIYAGRADGGGTRKGKKPTSRTSPLTSRLNDHAHNIDRAQNLRLEDFTARFLPLTPGWTPFTEAVVIRHFEPVWNSVVDGFGNHDVGAARDTGKRSRWDTVHPGRDGTGEQDTHRLEALEEAVADHLARTVTGATRFTGSLILPHGEQPSLFSE